VLASSWASPGAVTYCGDSTWHFHCYCTTEGENNTYFKLFPSSYSSTTFMIAGYWAILTTSWAKMCLEGKEEQSMDHFQSTIRKASHVWHQTASGRPGSYGHSGVLKPRGPFQRSLNYRKEIIFVLWWFWNTFILFGTLPVKRWHLDGHCGILLQPQHLGDGGRRFWVQGQHELLARPCLKKSKTIKRGGI
jgi:hypothetical protein